MLPIDRSGIKGIITCLKQGGLVALLPDQVPDRDAGSVHAPFFGQPAQTMTLVHQLVRRTKPKVVLGAAFRTKQGFRLTFTPLDTQRLSESAVPAATYLNQAIEGFVAEAPAQYQWEYKRFKRPPGGQPGIYA